MTTIYCSRSKCDWCNGAFCSAEEIAITKDGKCVAIVNLEESRKQK